MHTGFWHGNLDERNHLEGLDVGGGWNNIQRGMKGVE